MMFPIRVHGILFSDLNLPGSLKTVSVKNHACVDPIKKLYYPYGFEPMLLMCYYRSLNDLINF